MNTTSTDHQDLMGVLDPGLTTAMSLLGFPRLEDGEYSSVTDIAARIRALVADLAADGIQQDAASICEGLIDTANLLAVVIEEVADELRAAPVG